jgi:Leucine-rich repeat (LRR) protein
MKEEILKLLQSGVEENVELAEQLMIGQDLVEYFLERYKPFGVDFDKIIKRFSYTEIYVYGEREEIATKKIELLTDFTNLSFLDLSYNNLTTLPNDFSKLKKLQYLNLNVNNFTEIPKCVFELENLVTLRFEFCELTEIPDDIIKLKNLQHLVVSNNKITKLSNEVFKLTDLDILHLANNPDFELTDEQKLLKQPNLEILIE